MPATSRQTRLCARQYHIVTVRARAADESEPITMYCPKCETVRELRPMAGKRKRSERPEAKPLPQGTENDPEALDQECLDAARERREKRHRMNREKERRRRPPSEWDADVRDGGAESAAMMGPEPTPASEPDRDPDLDPEPVEADVEVEEELTNG